MRHYIYLLTLPNGKHYVGQTINPATRIGYDCHSYINNIPLYMDILQYGAKNVIITILKDDCTDENVDEFEVFYINQLRSWHHNYGYNISRGGQGTRNHEYIKDPYYSTTEYKTLCRQYRTMIIEQRNEKAKLRVAYRKEYNHQYYLKYKEKLKKEKAQ